MAAYKRAVSILGEEKVKQIRQEWDTLGRKPRRQRVEAVRRRCASTFTVRPVGASDKSSSSRKTNFRQVNIHTLFNFPSKDKSFLSLHYIRAIIPVGGSRIARLRKILENGIESLHTRRIKQAPWHAFTEEDVAHFKDHLPNRMDSRALTGTRASISLKPSLTWKIVHSRYVEDTTRLNTNTRTLSYSRFVQYVRYYFPGVRLKRTAEDLCDCCVRLDILLLQSDISDEEREAVLLEKVQCSYS
ncbi:hypothetical protein P3T76_002150 [Phytophthora citrophthora]|uniref:Uncharacterized protein n=1 Tax=Phytophthora citrophthora TaxID=4793 RepID=A0AAD9LR85_9STRA|nr:hypothetical protein P3T76_002150 [Phytophthora citrophthora]